ncbi:MAG: hypothetical protein M0C28_06470 [Candidatus Moduliflexus flocculans]|nr:hypothetical protein [Candidatus Moduliflexus flocculans]
MLAQAKGRDAAARAKSGFDYGDHDGKVSALEPLRRTSPAGWRSRYFSVESLDQAEDHLIFAAATDDGTLLDEESRPLTLPAASWAAVTRARIGRASGPARSARGSGKLQTNARPPSSATISERNARFFEAEADKLDGWADDLKSGLEREIKEIDQPDQRGAPCGHSRALRSRSKLAGQRQIKVAGGTAQP